MRTSTTKPAATKTASPKASGPKMASPKPWRVTRAFAGAAAAVLLVGTLAWAGLAGVVTAVSKHDVTVSGAVYEIQKDTRIEDLSGQQITLPELRPGTAVELEFDEEGNLVTIRAAVVR